MDGKSKKKVKVEPGRVIDTKYHPVMLRNDSGKGKRHTMQCLHRSVIVMMQRRRSSVAAIHRGRSRWERIPDAGAIAARSLVLNLIIIWTSSRQSAGKLEWTLRLIYFRIRRPFMSHHKYRMSCLLLGVRRHPFC